MAPTEARHGRVSPLPRQALVIDVATHLGCAPAPAGSGALVTVWHRIGRGWAPERPTISRQHNLRAGGPLAVQKSVEALGRHLLDSRQSSARQQNLPTMLLAQHHRGAARDVGHMALARPS
jgi:hypothetical protein